MDANRRTNHYKTFDWFKFENVLNIVMNESGNEQTLKFTKSDLKKWFENYNHFGGDFVSTDFNAFWSNVRGVECDYILKHFIKPKKSNDGWIYGFGAVAITMGLIIAAIKFNDLLISLFKKIVISF